MLSRITRSLHLTALSSQRLIPTVQSHSDENTLPSLVFTEQGSFHISIFQDLHFGENAWSFGPEQDYSSVQVLNEVLNQESPDLVVLNGDLITGENTFLENSTHYVDQIVAPFVERNLTWASTYGNHDYDFNITASTILDREMLFQNSRTMQMVDGANSGISNYYLPVYDASCSDMDCSPELLLWFFDSRGGWYYQTTDESGNKVGQPDWVDESVVAWFRSTNTDLISRHGKVIPSLAFVHIPTNASLALQEKGLNECKQPGINDDIPLAQQAQGWCADGSNDATCSYGAQDVPFMEALVSTEGLLAVFSGHDHGDTWCYKWNGLLPGMTVSGNGINLCFSQHSGYGGYGTWQRGARQVLVTKQGLKNSELDTWIRLETGYVTANVTLNATYGQDDYYPC